jgi:YfiH family protein
VAPDFIFPGWPAPPNVRALVTTRSGGVSTGPYASLNLGDHVGDDPQAIATNRQRLTEHLPAGPVWLNQVHGCLCVDAANTAMGSEADAAFSRRPGIVCAVMTADCLPVLLCDEAGSVVAAAHAGWRGMAAGVIETTIKAMDFPGERLMAWLGPAIGPQQFEVGEEVRTTFIDHDPQAADAFSAKPNGKWLCNIYTLARQRLAAQGICRIAGADFCTVSDQGRFFSYRRDGTTGRMASLIWLAE